MTFWKRDRTSLEWTILALSIAAIVAIIGGLVISSLTYESDGADLRVAVRPDGDGFVLTVRNLGGTTAEEVRVEVTRGTEKAEVQFRAIPKGDEEEAVVEIPGSGRPKARVTSYQER